MIQTLAMSDNVQLAVVAVFGTFVVAITPAIFAILMSISKRMERVEQNTNGSLSDMRARLDTAEHRLPSVSMNYPPGTEIKTSMSINDPTTADAPRVIENSTVVQPKILPEKSP